MGLSENIIDYLEKMGDYHYRLCSAPLIMRKLIDYLDYLAEFSRI